MPREQHCQRCGTCCRNGGPILHTEDLALVRRSIIAIHQLVTIRKGEPAFNPFTEKVEPAACEMIKLAGKGASWECLFYEASRSACVIHAERPLECRLLQCWDTSVVKAISGKDCLCRADLIASGDPLLGQLNVHEQRCAYAKALPLLQAIRSFDSTEDALPALSALMADDLLLRGQTVAQLHLSLQQELFYFGRPLFQTLQHPRLRVTWSASGLRLELIHPPT